MVVKWTVLIMMTQGEHCCCIREMRGKQPCMATTDQGKEKYAARDLSMKNTGIIDSGNRRTVGNNTDEGKHQGET